MTTKSESELEWRRLALQFDGHRMQAIFYLKAILQDPEKNRAAVEAFLAQRPLSGETVLAQRLAEIAQNSHENNGKQDDNTMV